MGFPEAQGIFPPRMEPTEGLEPVAFAAASDVLGEKKNRFAAVTVAGVGGFSKIPIFQKKKIQELPTHLKFNIYSFWGFCCSTSGGQIACEVFVFFEKNNDFEGRHQRCHLWKTTTTLAKFTLTKIHGFCCSKFRNQPHLNDHFEG